MARVCTILIPLRVSEAVENRQLLTIRIKIKMCLSTEGVKPSVGECSNGSTRHCLGVKEAGRWQVAGVRHAVLLHRGSHSIFAPLIVTIK